MNRDAIIAMIRSDEAALKQAGMDRIGIMHLLGDALNLPVDVSRRDTLNPLVHERMVKDAIKIF